MTTDPLTSWTDGAAKRAILAFVARVTQTGSADYVSPDARVAVFDNDGTLWCEKPMPIQLDFLLRRAGEMAARDPALRTRQPWKAVVEKDYRWLGGAIAKHYGGDDSDLKIVAAGLLQDYAGSTIEEFEEIAAAFLHTAQHPQFGRRYLECVFQPMIDLLGYLSANGFTNYIMSAGGRDFMRVVAESCYGISPEHVIGSSAELSYRDDGAFATVIHEPKLGILEDGPEKPVGIWSAIGRRPILAAGNSNGDIPMLRFCAHPTRPSLALLVQHDDDKREYAYKTGAEEALDLAGQHGWTIASVKDDWKTVFAA